MARNKAAAEEEEAGQQAESEAALSGLGRRVRELRRQNGWTLESLGRKSGMSISALSKIENEQVSASFDTIVRIARAFDLTFEEFFRPPSPHHSVPGRRTTTKSNMGIPFSTPNYDYSVHSADLTHKGMIPLIMRIRARQVPPLSEWSSHAGEEFIYVTAGSLELHTEFYAPAPLETGDSAYIDSSMRHFFISTSPEDATMLSICMTESLTFNDVVIGRRPAEDDNG
jgi:transcriptional regulator with XRE-family HTH domain